MYGNYECQLISNLTYCNLATSSSQGRTTVVSIQLRLTSSVQPSRSVMIWELLNCCCCWPNEQMLINFLICVAIRIKRKDTHTHTDATKERQTLIAICISSSSHSDHKSDLISGHQKCYLISVSRDTAAAAASAAKVSIKAQSAEHI